ncbi:MAG: preprotein translocase subunit SecE [Chloroflexota bacterium]
MARQPTARAQGGVSRGSGVRFFAEAFSELRKVTWPTRQEATRLTIQVLIVAAFFAAVLGGIDWIFARLSAILVGA